MSDINIYGHRTVETASFLVGDQQFDDVVLGVSHASLQYNEGFEPGRHGDALRDHLAKLSREKNNRLDKITTRRKALFVGGIALASMAGALRIVSGVDALSGLDDISEPAAQVSLTVAEGFFVAATFHEIATRSKRKDLQDDLKGYTRISAQIKHMQYEASPLHHRHSDEFHAPDATILRSQYAEFDGMGLENESPGAVILQFRPRDNGGHSA